MGEQSPPAEGGERRRHARYRVKDGALAFLGNVPGTIVDISESGMTVHYVVFEQEPARSLQLDIFFADQDFYLPAMPARLVSDMNAPGEPFFSAVQVKRLGIQFGELSRDQQQKLRYFILHSTVSST